MITNAAKTPEQAHAFLTQLRQQTAAAHQELEDIELSKAIVLPTVTPQQYAQYLQGMLAIHQDVEENIYPLLRCVVSDIDDRAKAHTLVSDLEVIGEAPATTATANPVTEGLPEITVPFALGIAYVIEGSTLGGRVILKNISPALGFTEDNGASYFAGYRERTGSAWKSFVEALTNYPENDETAQEVIAGAVHGFKAVYRHLSAIGSR